MSSLRTALCASPRPADVGKELSLCGWVATRRDHGGVIFIDLRDHSGIIQLVFEPSDPTVFAVAEALRPESVVRATGALRERPADTANPRLPTGEVELVVARVELLNAATTPAFLPDDQEVTEDTRLAHRAIDLRSRRMQANLRLRHQMARAVRKVLDERDFVEVETPILTKATPEGARDFLVPARNSPGSFYALPQSPQLFKQVLVAGGMDRYYQLARCFRDEDLRAGRQPEFTQIDVEMAFCTASDVMALGGEIVKAAFAAAGHEGFDAIPTLSHAEALARFGCDTPNLALEIELVDIAELVAACEFKVFAGPASTAGNRVVALRAPGGGELSRRQIDELTAMVRKLGAGGLAYLKVVEPGRGVAGCSSPIAKFLGDAAIDAIVAACAAGAGDQIFFGAGPAAVVNAYMAKLRDELGELLGLARPGMWPVWITAFPLFARDAATGALQSVHHPFTAPTADGAAKLLAGEQLEQLSSDSYDLVLNGIELGGGSIRIHKPELQLAALAALGLDEHEARDKFGFLLATLAAGAPPHGGIAYGFDRMAALAVGASSIREVIAFPKTQRGTCLFTEAPTPVDAVQLGELGLKVGGKASAAQS